jgi:hypothetical protein
LIIPFFVKETAPKQTLIKSFAGDSKGGGFSKESPLAAGGIGRKGRKGTGKKNYLSSDNGNANDVFHSGKLTGNKPGSEKPDRFECDPLEPTSEEHGWFAESYTCLDQTDALSGENLVYQG